MAKAVSDAGKFIRAVLVNGIQNPVNQPYTAGKAAELVAFLKAESGDPVFQENWESLGLKPPLNWLEAKAQYLATDPPAPVL